VLTRLSDARGRTVLSIALVSSLACEHPTFDNAPKIFVGFGRFCRAA
jgi:hypothetical protein